MPLILITFFISLAGITVLIGRKLIFSGNNRLTHEHDFAIDVPDLDEVKQITSKNLKKVSYILLVLSIRIYLLSKEAIKKQYKILQVKIEERRARKMLKNGLEVNKKVEPSRFLKMVSDYKKKIDKIKKKIEEEEGLN